MYAVTSIPFVRRTRAIFRSAEFGFFGVIVRTTVQTPRFWGEPRRRPTNRPRREFHVRRRAGVSTFLRSFLRPLRTSCAVVGICSFRLLLWTRETRGQKDPVARSSWVARDADAPTFRYEHRGQRGRRSGVTEWSSPSGPMHQMTAPTPPGRSPSRRKGGREGSAPGCA